MSSPAEHQSFISADPWHDQQPPPAQQPQPGLPPQGYWQPSPPVPKQSNGLAVTAIVIASVALLLGLGGFVLPMIAGGAFALASSGSGGPFGSPSMEGTAPQVVAGQAYPGSLLGNEVVRTISGFGADVTSVSCPVTPAVVADAKTVCHGPVDGSDATVKVTFEDSLGHFTVSWS